MSRAPRPSRRADRRIPGALAESSAAAPLGHAQEQVVLLAQRRLHGVPTGRARPWQLTMLVLLAAIGWTFLGEVVVRTDPAASLNRVWFLVSLTMGVFPLGALLAYAIRAPRVALSAARTCFPDSLREGWLLAAVVALNALLRMTNFWTPIAAGLVVGLAAIVDVVALSQRWVPPRDPS